MNYNLQIHPDFARQMKKLGPYQSKLIYYWIEKHLVNKDPQTTGKPLTANYAGSWRYRVGDYRIIADIIDDKLILHLLMVSHRSQSFCVSLFNLSSISSNSL